MKPKQVGEQHATLFSPEHNFRPKTIRNKKEVLLTTEALKEAQQWKHYDNYSTDSTTDGQH